MQNEEHASLFLQYIDDRFIVDEEGTECASLADMRNQAISTAGALLKDIGGKFPSGIEWQMHVTDEAKKTVLTLRFSIDERK